MGKKINDYEWKLDIVKIKANIIYNFTQLLPGSSWCLVSFTYPALLICVCTAYAVITRAIPEAFNESKYIGFTMYTTCIIWLSFVPLYLTVSGPGSSQLAIGVTVMCVSISLSASVTLVCMFAPKLYIILLHPEKNVRQPVGKREKYAYWNISICDIKRWSWEHITL